MTRTPIFLVPLTLLCLACERGQGETDTTSETGASSDTGESAAVTYHRDVKAILDAKCVQCHSPGNLAPFSLQSYADASTFAAALPPAIAARTMPPWPPDNACREYLHDRSLTADEQATITAWVELGAPEGDPAEAPPAPQAAEPIDYDVELTLPEPYTPTVAPDEYRCFLLPWPEDQDTHVTAITVTPGNRQIVHHVIVFAAGPEQAAELQALDDADPDPGYLCYGAPTGNKGDLRVPWLGAWVPGGGSGELPEGTGIHIAPGSLIAVQMHYHTYPGAGSDQSTIQLRTAPTVDRVASVLPFTNPAWPMNSEPMLIPAGDADVVHGFEAEVNPHLPVIVPDGGFMAGDTFEVHMAGLHMHTRGTSGTLSVVGGQDTCMLDIPRWDFSWQGNYRLARPITVRPGDKLRVECRWDNSADNQPFVDGVQQAPRDIVWGEGTNDEMCLATLYITGV